jgi:hypothetical protein
LICFLAKLTRALLFFADISGFFTGRLPWSPTAFKRLRTVESDTWMWSSSAKWREMSTEVKRGSLRDNRILFLSISLDYFFVFEHSHAVDNV